MARKTSSSAMPWPWRLLAVLYWVALAAAGIMGDECDWTGSGLTAGTSRGVTPVYLRCKAGRINWLYPRGALRVIMRLHNSNKDFKVCVKMLPNAGDDGERRQDLFTEDEVLDFREGRTATTTEEPFPARLFLEGGRGLVPLYASDDGSARSVRCFRSKNGQAAIYVEATPENGERRAARMQYDLQPLPAKAYDPAGEECRPCTPQEIAHAFCTSDLVTRGVIVGMQQRDELDTSELTIRITRLIRYVTPSGVAYTQETGAPHNGTAEYLRLRSRFLGGDDASHLAEGNLIGSGEEAWYARVQAGAQCGVAPGAGEFLVAARRRLGTLALACAPRVSEWPELVRKINEEGTAHCLLS